MEAVKWFRKAAAQNLAAAQYILGDCYDKGYGVAQDDTEAVKWYRKAAEQNCAPAQGRLGACYAIGLGRTAGLCGGGEMVAQSRRAESRQSSIQSRRVLRQCLGRGEGLCGGAEMVAQSRRAE